MIIMKMVIRISVSVSIKYRNTLNMVNLKYL